MEKKLQEKKMLLQVLGDIIEGMKYRKQDKQESIDAWEEYCKECRENGEKPDSWRNNSDGAKEYLAACETVEKYLEKLL